MSDVFVSYKAEDRRRIKPLVEALEADGYSVWWDEQIGGGTAWRHSIEAELNAAKCVIVAWSKRSVGPEGTFVQDEATRAQQRHVYVPVLIDKVHLPLGFGETQALPLAGWHGDRSDPHYRAIFETVRRITGRKTRGPARLSIVQPRVSRRAVVSGGAAAAAAIAGVGAWTLLKPGSASASRSIAVLPFANLSGDPAQAYFSDGIAEELRSALARIAGLEVVGRTSSEAVRNDDAATAAKKLGVANIVTGSVRQSPSTIRVSAELVDGRSGMDRWSQDYDRLPGDAIKIQTDIAENVATALSAALGAAAKAAVSIGGTQNPHAQRLYIQAGALAKGPPRKAELQQALRLIDSALALDTNYAAAYARKSGILGIFTNNYANAQELPQDRAESRRLAEIALRIAPKLPQAHVAMFRVNSDELQIAPALAEIQRAVQLAPGDADTLTSYAGFIGVVLGNTSEAVRLSDQAIGMDPLNPDPYNTRLEMLFFARRYGDAASYGKQLERNSPKLFQNNLSLADAFLMLGRSQEARVYYDRSPPDYWWRVTAEAVLAIRSGDRATALAKLAKLKQLYGDAASTQCGEIYALLGDKDRAFASLDRAFAIKDAGLTKIRTDPWLDPLRSDPRFAALLRKMNFPA